MVENNENVIVDIEVDFCIYDSIFEDEKETLLDIEENLDYLDVFITVVEEIDKKRENINNWDLMDQDEDISSEKEI